MRYFAISAVALSLFVVACDIGQSKDGPYKAYFLFQNSDGAVERFDLGGYDRMANCLSLLEYEVVEGGWDNLLGAFCINQDEYSSAPVAGHPNDSDL